MNTKTQKREIHDALVDALNQCAAVLSHIEQQYEKACKNEQHETDEQYKNRRTLEGDLIDFRLAESRINHAINAF